MNDLLTKVRPKIIRNVELEKIPGRGAHGKSRKAKFNTNTESIYEPKYELVHARPTCVRLKKNLLASSSDYALLSSSQGMQARQATNMQFLSRK